MNKTCERCGGKGEQIKTGPFAGQYPQLDYCSLCSKDLCQKCMADGCCGKVPAMSGTADDYSDDGE